MTNKKLLGIGNALVDIEFEVHDDFLQTQQIKKGQMTLIDADTYHNIFQTLNQKYQAKKRVGGGSAANSTVIFSQLGGKAHYCCRVANDEFGQFYTQDLQQQGVHCHPVYDNGVTGKCLVLITPDAERTMLTYLGATANLCVKDIDYTQLSEVEWLFMEGYLVTTEDAFEVAKKAIKEAKKYGTKIALSFSDPVIVSIFHPQITELLEFGIDLLFANEEETKTWAKKEQLSQACESISQHCSKMVITLGDKGCVTYSLHNKQLNHYPGIQTNVIDTNGAGDAFAGAFLYATTENLEEAKATELSNRVASTIVAQFGARMDKTKVQDCK